MRPHGVAGEVVVESWSEHEDRFSAGAVLLGPDGERWRVRSVRSHRQRLLVQFDGVDRDLAECLRGARLRVPREGVPPAPAGSYYHFELLGCRVEDLRDGELGLVEEIVEDGGGVLLRVEGRGRELLIPFVARYLAEVDVPRRRIVTRLPEGLIESCASTS